MAVGKRGAWVGTFEGAFDGAFEGAAVGFSDGRRDGAGVGDCVGDEVGFFDGVNVGRNTGFVDDGVNVGGNIGFMDGCCVGEDDGTILGAFEGALEVDGNIVGYEEVDNDVALEEGEGVDDEGWLPGNVMPGAT